MAIPSYKHHFPTVNPQRKPQIPKIHTVTKIQIRSINYQRTSNINHRHSPKIKCQKPNEPDLNILLKQRPPPSNINSNYFG